MTKVKLCGLKTFKDVEFALNCGVDFLGFVCVPKHLHAINKPELNKAISLMRRKGVKSVGIFMNQYLTDVLNISSTFRFDYIQLHGDETPEYCEEVQKHKPVFKAFSFNNNDEKEDIFLKKIKQYTCEYVIIDRKIQGKGEMVNDNIARKVAEIFPTFLAGGLNPENIKEKVFLIQPFGVDVSSGIETDGKPDHKKIEEFIRKVRSI